MAGAIGAHQRLLGTAPAARLLAVHAFSTSAATPKSTTFNILKGINWAVNQGVRIINMSFAGPKDPSLERALKVAYDRNIVLIAAFGLGPKSPPLYPGAYPDVIAVTATDVDDKLFAGANRGKYVSVSAPGVDILVPAPESTYQLTIRYLGRRRRSERHRRAAARTQPQAHARRYPSHPASERQTTQPQRARRQFRLWPHRPTQGAAARRPAHRHYRADACAETAMSRSEAPRRLKLTGTRKPPGTAALRLRMKPIGPAEG
jgi:hypothetical protein